MPRPTSNFGSRHGIKRRNLHKRYRTIYRLYIIAHNIDLSVVLYNLVSCKEKLILPASWPGPLERGAVHQLDVQAIELPVDTAWLLSTT